jgi:hypothetical protein
MRTEHDEDDYGRPSEAPSCQWVYVKWLNTDVNDKTCPATEMTQEVQSAGSSFHLDHSYQTLTSPPLRTAENLPPPCQKSRPKQNRGPNHHYSGDFESTSINLYLGKIVRGHETDRRLKSSSDVVSRFLRVELFLSCSPSAVRPELHLNAC